MLTQCLEPNPVLLFNGDCDMPRLAGIDIPHRTGFTNMCSPDDLALITIFQFMHWFVFHCRLSLCNDRRNFNFQIRLVTNPETPSPHNKIEPHYVK